MRRKDLGRSELPVHSSSSEDWWRQRVLDSSLEATAVCVDGVIVYANALLWDLIGSGECETLTGKPFIEFVHPSFRTITRTRFSDVTNTGISPNPFDLQMMGRDRRWQKFQIRVTRISWLGTAGVHVTVDTEPNARHDGISALTALMNSSDGMIAVVSVDLGSSVGPNDFDGLVTDAEARARALARLSKTVPDDGIAVWSQKDEYIVAVRCADNTEADELIRTVRESMSAPVPTDSGIDLQWSPSIGVWLGPARSDPAEAVADASIARREAARTSAQRIMYSHPQLRDDMRYRQLIATDLRRALATSPSRLRVFHQPLVDIRTGMPWAFEALVRWDDPARGLVLPGEFVPIAEEAGWIGDLDRHVMTTAISEFVATSWTHDLSLSVNISWQQLVDPTLPERVSALLTELDMPAERLMLEITESSLNGADADAVRPVERLRETGVSVALDDFGIGASSLSRLGMIPITMIKTPKQFVDALQSQNGPEMLSGIIDLAHGRGIEVIVEGIETADQERVVLECGGTLGQGFRYGRPATLDTFTPEDRVHPQRRHSATEEIEEL
ncbi:EAL domain-containing protein [Gordonia lacunae]|uniref:EAL domain-containing protein n=1 Tax=Gordonia TaxID=2053 RepID=UPI00200B4A7D|nr:EAL domain-containing protein [Gordonia terrae]UPW11963.1 EAL domain-containing protein [Gordonia terrae]